MGELVQLAEARTRFARQIAARRERDEIQRPLREARQARALEDSKRYWLRDLSTWPRAFQVRLRPFIEEMREADLAIGPQGAYTGNGWGMVGRFRLHRDRGGINPWGLIDVIRYLNQAIRGGDPKEIDWDQTRLLWELWVHGVRSIPRQEVVGKARSRVEASEEQYGAEIRALETRIAHLEENLRRGTVADGPRAGQPYAKGWRTRFQREIENKRHEIEYCQGMLALMPWARENPVAFATGAYPRRG